MIHFYFREMGDFGFIISWDFGSVQSEAGSVQSEAEIIIVCI